MPKSIKRHISLQALSREHHHGLLLAFKIRSGLKNKIDLKRIKKYCNWFWEQDLKAHFEFEEEFVFPILGQGNPLIERALIEHSRLKSSFLADDLLENLQLIEKEIVAHIRFEERILFKEIEKVASAEHLIQIEKAHSTSPPKAWTDEFWINKKSC